MLPRLVHPSPSGLSSAVRRYRIMAYIVGVWLIVLVFVGIPLQFAASNNSVVAIVGPLHGFLYIIYLFAALDLARRARFTLLEMAAMVGAGLLPFLAFIIERRVSSKLSARLAAAAAPAGVAPAGAGGSAGAGGPAAAAGGPSGSSGSSASSGSTAGASGAGSAGGPAPAGGTH